MCAFGSLRDIYTRSKNKRDENPPEGERARTNRVALMTFLITARLSMRTNIYAQWSFVYTDSDVAGGFLPFSMFHPCPSFLRIIRLEQEVLQK